MSDWFTEVIETAIVCAAYQTRTLTQACARLEPLTLVALGVDTVLMDTQYRAALDFLDWWFHKQLESLTESLKSEGPLVDLALRLTPVLT